MSQSMFIKSIEIDDQERIIVSVQEQFQAYLKEDMIKTMLKDQAKNALGEDFIQLEVSPSTFRITVKEGKAEDGKRVVMEEINKNIEMALTFLNNMK
ncbi:hypothetical protein EZV73_00030 [Acidaminobacter sp. JC074]|uniref:hypothetical protein n=1 Tax=Acidaminobacter sp. JC074 TaxID=2530199 RepID=UPI001F0DB2C3|nr:hypothetical protein [Acidaminobacter sp. JC074]MCH4885925.1 hypothetical protein [Acidaminobacter sp. JC074]